MTVWDCTARLTRGTREVGWQCRPQRHLPDLILLPSAPRIKPWIRASARTWSPTRGAHGLFQDLSLCFQRKPLLVGLLGSRSMLAPHSGASSGRQIQCGLGGHLYCPLPPPFPNVPALGFEGAHTVEVYPQSNPGSNHAKQKQERRKWLVRG